MRKPSGLERKRFNLRFSDHWKTITAQIFFREIFRRDQIIVPFRSNPEAVGSRFKLKKGDKISVDELGAYRSTNGITKLRSTNRYVLLNLYDTHPISSTLRLHRDNVVSALPIHADVHFIRFYLAEIRHTSTQVTL